MTSFLAGTLRTFSIVGLFVAGGLGAAALAGAPLRPAPAVQPPYSPGEMTSGPAATPPGCGGGSTGAPGETGSGAGEARPGRIWLVDGFNALHVGVLRGRERGAWWGPAGRERLLEELRRVRLEGPRDELWVVFDGPREGEEAPRDAGPGVVFARCADDWLLRRVRKEPEPARVTVVTADRSLADRARGRGAQVEAPAAFLARRAS